MTKPKKSINIGQPTEDTAKTGAVVAKFEQLVKEVDQCFAELGRQMQRESKSRHDFENKLKDRIYLNHFFHTFHYSELLLSENIKRLVNRKLQGR